MLANTLVRAGVGHVRIVDRDFIELNNLQRQVLFDEDDVAADLPKAIAAANKLRRINSQIEIEPIVADVDHTNIEQLCDGVDCIVDGTDNFETRFLLNDAALKLGIPWVYGGCLGCEGQTMTILPGETPCLRCLMPEPPPPGTTPTCDTAGILAPIINVIASIQASEAIKILSGHREAISRVLTIVDLWDNRMRQIKLAGLRETVDCPACRRGEFPWLSRRARQPHGRALRPQRRAAHLPAAPAAVAGDAGRQARRRRPGHAQSVPAAAGGRRLPAHRLPRRPRHHRRHRRHRHGPHAVREVHRHVKRSCASEHSACPAGSLAGVCDPLPPASRCCWPTC